MDYIRPFEKLGKGDGALAGGKGASLGEMTRLFGGQAHARNPIPPGFVILAESFEYFLSANELHAQIEEVLSKVNIHDTNSVETASERLRAIFDAAPMPTDLEELIIKAWTKLAAEFVAVRSSATTEDSAASSWAGELESYLYTTKSTLTKHVKDCWSSLFTPRAIFYRTEKGMAETKVSVAVVVQVMIPSEVSGVCFTVHPVTKDTNQLIIEAGWGLGEAIVGGMITPDSYVVDKRDGTLIDTYISEQLKKIVRKPEGGTAEVEVALADRQRQKLSHNHVLEMAKLAEKIEHHYGSPQDIEWALADGRLWVVQSRPITTL